MSSTARVCVCPVDSPLWAPTDVRHYDAVGAPAPAAGPTDHPDRRRSRVTLGERRVSDLPAPTAARLPRARWLDTRLLLGLLLVLASIVVGAKVLADADERVAVWAVTRDLAADSLLAEGDVAARAVRLDGVAGRYVSAAEDLEGLVLGRPVGRGELLPVAALRGPGASDQRRVVIEVDRVGVAGLAKGGAVDLYVVREPADGQAPRPPELVLAGVTVAEDVRSGGSGFGGGGATVGVALLVDRADVPDVIDAVAHGSVYVVQDPT